MWRAAMWIVVLALAGCSRVPGCSRKGSEFKRSSEKMTVACDEGKGRKAKDGCVTDEIRCGDRIQGTTDSGNDNFGGEFYRTKFCAPFDAGYGGNDRTYLLKLDPHTNADIWLDGDCADLDLFGVRWRYDGKCPTASHNTGECEADQEKSGGHIRLNTTSNPAEFLVIVDGKREVMASFGLVVDCTGQN